VLLASRSEQTHDGAVAPASSLGPLVERQQGSALRFDTGNQIRRPGIVLPALGTHFRVRRSKHFRVPRDTTARIQVNRFERADNRPAQPEAIPHQPINVLHTDDAVTDQAVRLSQQCSLQPIENEAAQFFFDHNWRQVRRTEKFRGPTENFGRLRTPTL
jgi:hypothetical protein